MTRMSLGSHNHLAVSLAPPRLYFTGLKTLRALSSMPTPLFVRKRCPLTAQNPAPLPFRWATGSTFLSACRGPVKYPPCPAAFARPFSLNLTGWVPTGAADAAITLNDQTQIKGQPQPDGYFLEWSPSHPTQVLTSATLPPALKTERSSPTANNPDPFASEAAESATGPQPVADSAILVSWQPVAVARELQ